MYDFRPWSAYARAHRNHVAWPTTQLALYFRAVTSQGDFPDMWPVIINGDFLCLKIFNVLGLSCSPMFCGFRIAPTHQNHWVTGWLYFHHIGSCQRFIRLKPSRYHACRSKIGSPFKTSPFRLSWSLHDHKPSTSQMGSFLTRCYLIASLLCSFSRSPAEEPKVRGIAKYFTRGVGPLKLETHLRWSFSPWNRVLVTLSPWIQCGLPGKKRMFMK